MISDSPELNLETELSNVLAKCKSSKNILFWLPPFYGTYRGIIPHPESTFNHIVIDMLKITVHRRLAEEHKV